MADNINLSKNILTREQSVEGSCDESYHSLFEQATDAIMVTDFTGNFKDVNASLCALFGYSKDELLQLNVHALLDPEHVRTKPIRFDTLAKGDNTFNERQMVHRNGTTIFVEANAKKLSDDRILVIARDITERKKVEMVLKKSEANLHTIFDTTDTIYVLLDNQLRVISYNPRARAFAVSELNHSIEISEYFLDYFPEDKRPVLQGYMEQVLKGKHVNYEVSYPQPANTYNWYHVRMFPISKGDNDIYGLMLAVSDITVKRKLEKELLAQKVEEQKNIIRAVLKAQEIERNKIGQELHDNVNQILSTLRLYLGLMEKDQAINYDAIKKSKEILDIAVEEIRSLCRKQVTPTRKFDLKELIERLIRDLNQNVHQHTKFYATVSSHLSMDEDLKLNIYRIVQEQVNNILKYACASKATISITEENYTVLVTIKDDGKGFDPLVKRSGVGISNIFNRVESYNGAVTIKSSPGKGCAIEIAVPCCMIDQNDDD